MFEQKSFDTYDSVRNKIKRLIAEWASYPELDPYERRCYVDGGLCFHMRVSVTTCSSVSAALLLGLTGREAQRANTIALELWEDIDVEAVDTCGVIG